MRGFGTDKGREGVQNPKNLADVICTCPLINLAPRFGAFYRVTTHPRPDVDGLGVRNGWQRVVDRSRLRGHGEECCYAERDSGGDGIRVQPEADPRHDHQHAAGDVDGE